MASGILSVINSFGSDLETTDDVIMIRSSGIFDLLRLNLEKGYNYQMWPVTNSVETVKSGDSHVH